MTGSIVWDAGGRELKKLRFSAQVDIFGDVVCARRFLARHQAITAQDVQRVEKNLALLPGDVITAEAEIVGKRTSLAVNGREVFRGSMVEPIPIIKKGDRVVLVFENARFRITAQGEACEGGRKGDRLKLLNVSTRKEVFGRVLDAQTVRVEF